MHNFISFLIFLMTISIPAIAIVAELSKKTPSSISYSIIRSFICLGSLFFLSIILNPLYVPTISHFITIGFIFSVSLGQLFLEFNDTDFKSFVKEKFTQKIHN